MGEVIENKVVQIAFENTKFEKGVQATLNILSRLNNAISGLNTIKYNILGVADQVKAVTFEPINAQLEIGIGKAMALTAALTGVYNISDQIYSTVVGTVRSFTFDQIDNGMARYEQVVNSTQTILASVKEIGASEEEAMDRVAKVQESLLWFADETSYDAQSMLQVISQFTSHGIELEEAAQAMEGIANWASVAGANVNQATIAMQQLAQTMGQGYVGGQDWMSIISQNMDISQFKELIIDAAVARGELKKVGSEVRTVDGTMSVTSQNIEKTLSKKWFTKDVLMDVLKKYGEAVEMVKEYQEREKIGLVSDAIDRMKELDEYQDYLLSLEAFEMGQVARTWTDAYESVQTATATKISEIFKAIFGDYLEAKELWTDISEKLYYIFVEPLDTLMWAFRDWADPETYNGSKRVWESFNRIFNSIEECVRHIWTIFSDIFGDGGEEKTERAENWMGKITTLLNQLTIKIDQISIKFKKFMDNIQKNEKIWDNVTSFINGLKIGLDLLTKAGSAFNTHFLKPLFGHAEDGVESVTSLGGSFEKLMIDIQNAEEETDFFNTTFDKLSVIADKTIGLLITLFDNIEQLVITVTQASSDGKGGGFFSTLAKSAEDAEGPIDKIFTIINWAIDFINDAIVILEPTFEGIVGFIVLIFQSIGDALGLIGPSLEQIGTALKEIFGESNKIFSTDGEEKLTFDKVLTTIADAINNFLSGNTKANIDNFIYLLSSMRTEIKQWIIEIFGESDVLNVFSRILEIITDRTNAMLLVFIEIGVLIAQIDGIFERVKGMQWDGILGSLLWGEALTDFMDQKYYEALAKTFSAVADGILAIAAALFIISLIPMDKMESSIMVLDHIGTIMFTLIITVELLVEVIDRFVGTGSKYMQTASALGGKGKGVLGSLLGSVVGDSFDMMTYTAKLSGIALIIGAVTTGFIKIAAAMYIISKIPDPQKIMPILWGMVGMVSVLMILITAMTMTDTSQDYIRSSSFEKFGKNSIVPGKKSSSYKSGRGINGILQNAIALLLVTAAVAKLAKAVKTLSGIPADDLVAATASLSTMIIVVGVFMALLAVLDRMTEHKGNFIAIGRMVSMVGWAILMLSGALVLITSSKHIDQMPEAAKWLGIAFAALTAVVVGLVSFSKILTNKNIRAVTAMASLILALSVPLIAIAIGLRILAGIDDQKALADAALALGGVFAAFGVLVAFASNIKAGRMVALAAGMAIILVSCLTLIPILKAISEMGDTGAANFEKIFIGLGAGLMALVAAVAIIANNPALIGYLFAVAGAILTFSLVGVAVSASILLTAMAFDMLVTSIKQLINLPAEDMEKLADNVKKFAESTIIALSSVVAAIPVGIVKGILEIVKMKDELFKAVRTLIIDFFAMLSTVMPEFESFVLSFILSAIRIFNKVTPLINEALTMFVRDALNWLLPLLNEFMPQINDFITTTVDQALDQVLGLAEKYMPRINDFITVSVDQALTQIMDLILKFVPRTILDTINILRQVAPEILDFLNDFGVLLTEKVVSGTIRISMAIFSGLIEGFTTGIPEFADEMAKMLIEFLNAMADVIDDNGDEILDAIDRLMESITNFIWKAVVHWGEEGGVFFEGGVQVVSGLTRGIASKLKVVKEAAFSLGDWVKSGFCKVLRIESPSKVFEQFGQYIPQGLINGLNEKKKQVYDMFSDFANKAKGSFSTNFGNFSNIGDKIKELFKDLSPEIAPTLNLSNIKESLGSLTDLMNGQQLSGMLGVDGFSMGDISLGNDSVSINNGIEALNGKMDQFLDIERYNAAKPTDVNVILQGDASKMLKVIGKENAQRVKATGYNKLKLAKA